MSRTFLSDFTVDLSRIDPEMPADPQYFRLCPSIGRCTLCSQPGDNPLARPYLSAPVADPSKAGTG